MSGRRGRGSFPAQKRREPQHPPPQHQTTMQYLNQNQLIQQQQQQQQLMNMSLALPNAGYGIPAPFVYGMNPPSFYPGIVSYPMTQAGMYQPVYINNQPAASYPQLQQNGVPIEGYIEFVNQEEFVEGAENHLEYPVEYPLETSLEDQQAIWLSAAESPHPIWKPPKDQPQPTRQPFAPREKKVLTFIDPNTQETVTFNGGEKRTACSDDNSPSAANV